MGKVHRKLTLGILDELNNLRVEEQRIARQRDRLLRPLLSDVSRLADVKKAFLSECTETDSRMARKMFFFVCVFLYSPKFFVGKGIRRGLRPAIVAQLDNKTFSPSLVFLQLSQLCGYLSIYKDLREETVGLLGRVALRLLHSGVIDAKRYARLCGSKERKSKKNKN